MGHLTDPDASPDGGGGVTQAAGSLTQRHGRFTLDGGRVATVSMARVETELCPGHNSRA